MALPNNGGIFIHEGYNCTPVLVPTAQSIPMSTSDSTTVYSAISSLSPALELIDTLTAGSTTLVISDVRILASSTVDIYTDVFGVNPTNAVLSDGYITLTFDIQENDLGVKVRIS